jgi:hypothetical protein
MTVVRMKKIPVKSVAGLLSSPSAMADVCPRQQRTDILSTTHMAFYVRIGNDELIQLTDIGRMAVRMVINQNPPGSCDIHELQHHLLILGMDLRFDDFRELSVEFPEILKYQW